MSTKIARFTRLPRLTHFWRLNDKNGVFQHSQLSEPDPAHGYSLDDNARCLLVATMLQKIEPADDYLKLAERTLAFLENQKAGGGEFRNYRYVSETGDFLSRETASDGLGELIWACGYLTYTDRHSPLRLRAENLIDYGLKGLREDQGLRQASYALAGLAYQVETKPNRLHEKTARQLMTRLVDHYCYHSNKNWRWFESWLVYANAILPWGLLVYGRLVGDETAIKIGIESLDFLIEQTMLGHLPVPVGQKRWFEQGKTRSIYDQQPIEAGYMVLACLEAKRITKQEKYLRFAHDWFGWFWGNNIENLILIDEADGGCYDGLQPWSVNQNKGSESTICYLLAHLALYAYDKKLRRW